jgi:hypothetical protein
VLQHVHNIHCHRHAPIPKSTNTACAQQSSLAGDLPQNSNTCSGTWLTRGVWLTPMTDTKQLRLQCCKQAACLRCCHSRVTACHTWQTWRAGCCCGSGRGTPSCAWPQSSHWSAPLFTQTHASALCEAGRSPTHAQLLGAPVWFMDATVVVGTPPAHNRHLFWPSLLPKTTQETQETGVNNGP